MCQKVENIFKTTLSHAGIDCFLCHASLFIYFFVLLSEIQIEIVGEDDKCCMLVTGKWHKCSFFTLHELGCI